MNPLEQAARNALENFRCLVVADLHVHDDPHDKTRLHRGIRLLHDLEKLAKQNDIRTIIVAGDMWHQKHGVNQRVLLALYRRLQAMKMHGYRIIWLRGNHEVTTKSHPHDTLMWLFAKVACTIVQPKIVATGAYAFYFLPWYLENPYKKYAKQLAHLAFRDRRPKVLISHVGLKDGYTSASNIQLPQPISVGDLYPEVYDLVLLGDYHAHQMVGDNALYLGSPVPHQHGDRDTVGAWLLSIGRNGVSVETMDLPSRHPDFRTWDLSDVGPEDRLWLGESYNENDFNRIIVPLELAEKTR